MRLQAFPAGIALAWGSLALLTVAGASVPGLDRRSAVHLAICAVTVLGALSCLWRVATQPTDRLGWGLTGAGLACYAAGFVTNMAVRTRWTVGGLHLSDCITLPLFPLAFLGVLALSRRRRHSATAHLADLPDPDGRPVLAAGLDATVVTLSLGAAIVALVVTRNGDLFSRGDVHVIETLGYPIGSLALFAAALAVVALRRWRAGLRWALLLVGFGALSAGDLIYAFQAATSTFHFGTPLDSLYTAGPALVGIAAWQRGSEGDGAGDGEADHARPGAALAIPGTAVLTALGVLLADHVHHLPGMAVALAGAAIALSVLRTSVFLRQERRFERANRDSLTDPLTGLANRRALERMLAPRLAEGWPTTLLLVDLDGFKEINDTLGHAAGDELLVGLALRLEELETLLLVARIGGDEFALVLDDRVTPLAYADEVCRSLEQPLLVDGAVVAVGTSIGLAAADPAPEGVALISGELLRRADVAMSRAKQLRTGIEAWEPGFDTGTRERLEVMAALRQAITDPAQVVVHYQPQFDSRSREVIGLEALVRWQHPVRGLLAPGEFLFAAEHAGLLPALTTRVLDTSLAQVRHLADAGHRIPVSVNVTAPDLLDLRFADRVAAALARHGVSPELLRIEITETVVMTDPARVSDALDRLHALGIRLSLDDYGTGLSSLSYLQSLPVDELKIDRSFVSRITCDPASAIIVASTIDLAHALDLAVVAEGVEDEATLEVLSDARCDSIQGFLLGRPQPAHALGFALAAGAGPTVSPAVNPGVSTGVNPGVSPGGAGGAAVVAGDGLVVPAA